MAVDDRLVDLLLQWEELRDQGQVVSPEELCKDCPELLDEVRRRMRFLDAVQVESPATAAPETALDAPASLQTCADAFSSRPGGDLQADQRLEQGDARALDVHVDRRLRHPLLGALLRLLGAFDVDLAGLFGDLREDRDAIGLHLREPERDHE